MKQQSKNIYLYLQYAKDLCLVLQLFMLPFIYYFFITSHGYAQGLSLISSVWFLILVLLFIGYVSSIYALHYIESHYPYPKELSDLKNNRYRSTILAGYIFSLSLINLVVFLTFTVFSLFNYQTTLGIYKENSYLIIIHIEIFVLTLYMLLRLNAKDHNQYLPLIDLFQNESLSEHKVIKKPLW
ncbi:MAG: hypothetical protein ACNA7K_05180 [Acholeplasmataceae bacterium]